jgi:hypothetical protein
MPFDFTPDQERRLFQDLQEANSRMQALRAKASPQLAQQVGQLYRDHPYAPPGLLLSTAQAVQTGMMDNERANNFVLAASQNSLNQIVQTPKEEKKSWFERNVMQKVRTASRWTMAGLNFVPQVATNVASQVFKEGGPSTEGFFISTDLGTLIANDEVAGDGWFLGGKAWENQAERARRYRGEIDGHAWTFGRGTASVISQPGSRWYNILSGVVDAAAAIVTPSVPGLAVAKGATATVAGKAGLRTLAGLTDFESAFIQTDKVAGFLQSRGGQSIVKRISQIKTIDEALDIFKDVQHMDFINKVVDLTDEGEIRNYLVQTLGKPIRDSQGNIGKGVSSIDQINLSRWDDFTRGLAGRSSFVSRMMASVPGKHIILSGGNPRDVAQSVRNINNYMKTLRVDDATRNRLVKKYSEALVNKNGDVFSVVKEFDEIFEASMNAMGVPPEAIADLRRGMKEFVENKNVYGAIFDEGDPTAYGARVILQDGTVVKAPMATAGLESEMLKTLSTALPDPDQVRRVMSRVGWIYGKGMLRKADAKKIGKLRNEIAGLRRSIENVDDNNVVAPVLEKIGKLQEEIAGLSGPKLRDPSKYGQLRMPLSALESFQNEIWRPITLMTGGYVLRNMADSAFRYTMTPGLKGGVLHPIQWIQIASGRRFRGTLKGQVWDELLDDQAARIAREGIDEFDQAVGQGIREAFAPGEITRQGFRDSDWGLARRTSGSTYRKGIQDEVTLLHDDAVAKMVAEGLDTDEIIEILRRDPQYARRLQARWANREMEVVGQPGTKVVGTPDFVRADGSLSDVFDENMRYYIDEYVRKRVDDVTGQNEVLRRAIATGEIEDANGNILSIFDLDRGGGRGGYSQAWTDSVQRVIDEDNARIAAGETGQLKEAYKYGNDVTVVNPNIPGRELPKRLQSWGKATDYFFSSLYPRRSRYLMQSPVFRQYYWAETGKLIDELDLVSVNQIKRQLTLTRYNEARTAAKQPLLKYSKNGDLGFDTVDKAGKKVFQTLKQSEISALPKLDDAWLARYVGDGDTAKTLWGRIQNPKSGGKLTLDELDAYAKGSALDQTKNLFYNASEKSNFADILRIAVPFGSAWAEVMNTWGKIAISNPVAVRRVGLATQGLKNADPDGDGKGFFWKDPVTGEYVFNYPFSDQIGGLAAALTPIGALAGGVAGGLPGIAVGAAAGAATGFGLQEGLGLEPTRVIAPVKSLSMGLNIYPGLGPFAQISAGKILNRTPKADFIRDIVLPYGEPDITTIGPIPVPSWGRKFIDGLIADPDSSRLLGDLTIDVMRVLHASGEYDLSDEEERERLENDAVSRARVLLVLRGFGQFVGPVRPDIEFEVATKQGDKYTVELAKTFREMQTENYDTAVTRFLETFGEDAFLYMQGKTQATAGGLDASTKFGQFERDNTSLFNRFPKVAGYFAEVGANFDYAVYVRQLETGLREKLNPSEFLKLAQETIGRALYRSSQRAVGPNPDEYQKEALRSIKALLEDRYPGYKTTVIDINAARGRIKELQDAAFSPLLQDNTIAVAARAYFNFRDQALVELQNRGIVSGDLSVKAAADLRAYLRNAADILIKRYPEFERLYDRVLYNEIEGL